jgi:hypothetical protein
MDWRGPLNLAAFDIILPSRFLSRGAFAPVGPPTRHISGAHPMLTKRSQRHARKQIDRTQSVLRRGELSRSLRRKDDNGSLHRQPVPCKSPFLDQTSHFPSVRRPSLACDRWVARPAPSVKGWKGVEKREGKEKFEDNASSGTPHPARCAPGEASGNKVRRRRRSQEFYISLFLYFLPFLVFPTLWRV